MCFMCLKNCQKIFANEIKNLGTDERELPGLPKTGETESKKPE